jgi:microcystin-dependent protein
VEIPIGGVIAFAGDPSLIDNNKWTVCDGKSLEISKNVELFKVIKWTYGYGNDVENRRFFSVPDYRGVFLRGLDQGAGRDPDAVTRVLPYNDKVAYGDKVGSKQLDAIQSHKHLDSGHDHKTTATNAAGQVDSDNSSEKAAPPNPPVGSVGLGYANLGDPVDSETGAGKPRLSKETRPINISVVWIIRIK